MSNEPNQGTKPIAVVAVLLLLCAGVAAWLIFKSRQAKTPNLPPIAALRLDSLDESNRVATLSDNGSHDPDGTLQSWHIDWGDGKEDNLAALPQKKTHTYDSEGEYTISLWCVDNSGATSSPPATANITFDLLKRQKALEQTQAEAKREADRLKEDESKKEAERLEKARQNELAAQAARKAKEQQMLADARQAAAQKAKDTAKTPAQPPRTPLAAGLPDNPSSRTVIYTPSGYTLGQYQISKEKIDGKGQDGSLLVILVLRCINFPNSPIATADWQMTGRACSFRQAEFEHLFHQESAESPRFLRARWAQDLQK